jgi:hypothetical protein
MNSHISVTPLVTTTYTYTATGPGGSATAQATVTVTPPGPAPTVTLSVSSNSIFNGQAIDLTWASTNATLLAIDNNVGAVQPITGGSILLFPLVGFSPELERSGQFNLYRDNTCCRHLYPGCYFYLGAPTTTNGVSERQANSIAQCIDSVGDRLMPCFAYRNFGSYESFLISQTLQTGLSGGLNPWQTGIRWYELRDNLSALPRFISSAP